MKSIWLMFVPLLKLIKCESLFLNQVFINIKSYVFVKSKIASPDSFITPYPEPPQIVSNPSLFQHGHSGLPQYLIFSFGKLETILHVLPRFFLNGFFKPYLSSMHTNYVNCLFLKQFLLTKFYLLSSQPQFLL